MPKKRLVLTDSERCWVEAFRKICSLTRKKMKALDIRHYEPHYFCEEEMLNTCSVKPCNACEESSYDSSINVWDCPCGLDYADPSCYRWFEYANVKEVIIRADMMLRLRLGDVFKDDYSDFLEGIYL